MHRESECGISYRISSNNSRGNYFFFHIKRGRLLIEGRRLIEILLTGSLALNILFYYHIKKNWTWAFQVFQIWFPDKFSDLDRHWSVLLADSSSTWQGGNKRQRGVRGAIMRGRRLIEGWLLLVEIRYIIILWNFPVFLSLFGRDFNQIEPWWFGFQV